MEYTDVKTVAKMMGKTPQWIRWLIREGKIEATRLGDRNWLISKTSVEAYQEKQKTK